MTDDNFNGGIHALMRMAGFKIETSPATGIDPNWQPQDNFDRLFGPLQTEQIDAALSKIGAQSGILVRERSNVENAIAKSRFRMPSKGQAATPDDIMAAISGIADGLQMIGDGLRKLSFARRTAGTDATQKAVALEQVHHAILGEIIDRVMRGLPDEMPRPTYDQLADVMPQYSPSAFSDRWRGQFELAAAKVTQIHNGFETRDFSIATTRPTDDVFIALIGNLATIYKNVTGREATSPNASGNLPTNWRSQFSQFVADLWPLVGIFGDDEKDQKRQALIPSNKRIRGALGNRTNKHPNPLVNKSDIDV